MLLYKKLLLMTFGTTLVLIKLNAGILKTFFIDQKTTQKTNGHLGASALFYDVTQCVILIHY